MHCPTHGTYPGGEPGWQCCCPRSEETLRVHYLRDRSFGVGAGQGWVGVAGGSWLNGIWWGGGDFGLIIIGGVA